MNETNAVIDPWVLSSIGLIALAVIIVVLVICANQVDADRRKPPQ